VLCLLFLILCFNLHIGYARKFSFLRSIVDEVEWLSRDLTTTNFLQIGLVIDAISKSVSEETQCSLQCVR